MMFLNVSDAMQGTFGDTAHTELNRIVDALEPLFITNGWEWLGKVPSRSDISMRLLIMIHETLERMIKQDKDYATVSTGRLHVEMRTADSHKTVSVAIGVMFFL